MEIVEKEIEYLSFAEKQLDIRSLAVGESVFVYLVKCKEEIKNDMGEVYFINRCLDTPLDKAKDFKHLITLAKKGSFFGNAVINNAIDQGKIKEGDLIKITKKANRGDVVQQKHGKKKINYHDYKITICTDSLTYEQLLQLKSHYSNSESDYIDSDSGASMSLENVGKEPIPF